MASDVPAFFAALKESPELQKKFIEASRTYKNMKAHGREWESIFEDMAREAGFNLTVNDVKEYAESLNPNGELASDELNNVAGGINVRHAMLMDADGRYL